MIDVTCAVIRNDSKDILVVQRGVSTDHPLKWEFPGGKLADGETDEECVVREVDEELSIDVVICGRLPYVVHDYGFKKVKLIPFICDTLDEIPVLSEHVAYQWVQKENLLSMNFSEADVFVARSYIEDKHAGEATDLLSGKDSIPESLPDTDLREMIKKMTGSKEAEWIANYAGENRAVFLKLLEYSYSSDKVLAFRASWTLSKACEKYPKIITPYLTQVIERLQTVTNESALRSFLRLISFSDLDTIGKTMHGLLADYCFNALNSGFAAVAVKVYSMEILYKLTVIYPELGNELATSVRILMEDGTAGIISRGKKILKKISGVPLKP